MIVSLKEITDRITKGTTPHKEAFDGVDVNFIKSESLNYNGNIDINSFNSIDMETHNTKLKRSILNERDILISIAGANLGKIGIVSSEMLPANTNQAVGIISINPNLARSKYIYYYLQQLKIRNFINNSVAQSAQPNINLSQLSNLKIELPDMNIQDKIIKVLDTISEKINVNTHTNNNLYKIITEIISTNFIKNKDTVKGKVQDIGKIQGGFAFKSNDLLDIHTNNRIMKIKNITNNKIDIDNTQYVLDEVANKVDKKFELTRGDVIVAMTGAELGKTGYIFGNENRYFLNQRVGVIRGFDIKKELYLKSLFLLKETQDLLNSMGYGSAQPNISTSDIENIEITIPSEKELEELYKIINPIFNKLLNNSEEIHKLSMIRDTLLPKLMNGEIDLDKIEI